MTRQRSFKRLVRSRMKKTGESYTTARASLLAPQEPQETEEPALATSDESIRRRTGRGWEEWFDLLDEWGAADRPHREIARWVAEQQGVEPLAWGPQAVTVSYERARGGRAVGEHPGGFAITASKTVAVSVERLFARVRGRRPAGALALGSAADAPHRHRPADGPVRLGGRVDEGQRDVRRARRRQEQGGGLPRAAGRRRRGRGDEGVVAGAAARAQAAARGG